MIYASLVFVKLTRRCYHLKPPKKIKRTTGIFIKWLRSKLKNLQNWNWFRDYRSLRRFARLMEFRVSKKQRQTLTQRNSATQTKKDRRHLIWTFSRSQAASQSSSNRNLSMRGSLTLFGSVSPPKKILMKIITSISWTSAQPWLSSINYLEAQTALTRMNLLENRFQRLTPRCRSRPSRTARRTLESMPTADSGRKWRSLRHQP